MLDENLVHSFWTSKLFLDSCKRWEVQEDTGIFNTLLVHLTAEGIPPMRVLLVEICPAENGCM